MSLATHCCMYVLFSVCLGGQGKGTNLQNTLTGKEHCKASFANIILLLLFIIVTQVEYSILSQAFLTFLSIQAPVRPSSQSNYYDLV